MGSKWEILGTFSKIKWKSNVGLSCDIMEDGNVIELTEFEVENLIQKAKERPRGQTINYRKKR